ncbi:MAG: PAS domain-containing protein [Gemmatimonadetes bacterium]|jgi:two-component system, cell cycle sensor histidine kinase and response regulator CckA|nr:PAS domain-containing protein [Gemmatimonadota bacterium]
MPMDNLRNQYANHVSNADKERLLLSIHKVLGSVLPTMTMDAILANVSQALLQAGIFRSLMIALVDQNAQTVEVVTSVVAYAEKRDPLRLPDAVPVGTTDSIVVTEDEKVVGLVYPLDDTNITAQVARTGVLTVANEWNEQMDARVDTEENWTSQNTGKSAYFIPLVFDDEVIGVVATGSLPEENDAVMARIELIQPLLDLVAASLHHAQQAQVLHREYRVRDSVAAVRVAIATMNTPTDMARVVSAIHQELRRLDLVTGPEHTQYSIQIVNPAGTDFVSVAYGSELVEKERLQNWQGVSGNAEIYPWVLDVWREQKVRYVTDFVLPGLPPGEGTRDLNLVDVPFSNGTLALNSLDPIPVEVIRILEQFAEALTDGWEMFVNISERELAEQKLSDTNTLLRNLHEIIGVTTSSLDREQVLDTLGRQVVTTGVLRSLTVVLVDREKRRANIVRTFNSTPEGATTVEDVGSFVDFDSPDMTADTIRSGMTQIVVGCDERLGTDQGDREGQVAYFVPIKYHGDVIAVVATGSTVKDQEETTQLLTQMQPLWDQVAVALSNAALHEMTQQEISERRRVEEALSESEQRLTEAQRVGEVGSFTSNVTTGRWSGTAMLYRIMGIEGKEEYSVEEWVEILHPEDREMLASYNRSVVDQGVPFDRDYRIVRKSDGEIRWVYSRGEMQFDESGSVVGMVGTTQDITERKRLEAQVLRMERQSASAELAAGISHNLNNILTSISLPADVLLMKSGDAQVVRREAEHIRAAAGRARELVQRLSDSVRPRHVDTKDAVDLNDRILETVELARPRWHDEPQVRGVSVEVVTQLGEIPHVDGNAGELSEVILNLLFNATDAMPDGGTITLSTRPAVEEGFVTLTVADTGTGMDETTCRRVFEPFFTTKVDVGSGLGLSTAYGTVTRSGGTMAVESEVGCGTIFTARLPVAEGGSEEEEAVADHTKRSGRILLVDDDQLICDVLQRILSEEHTVEVVGDGADALKGFTPGRFQIALIDLGLPTVPGDKVAAEMRDKDPALVTVLMTGWVIDEGDPRLSNFDLHLPKPIEVSDLDQIVSEAMTLHDSRV